MASSRSAVSETSIKIYFKSERATLGTGKCVSCGVQVEAVSGIHRQIVLVALDESGSHLDCFEAPTISR